uniref:PDZ domain-containing protein n=1 Tax=Calcidiscus leptoporus TaxID=127549 RepID=A0A7S0J3Y2_9EUKA|mmetsp:Transcript_37028/g.86500  ORF Transcript_37028/g.86500 Transcript_37028/m.86500 type:complete len:298 (+) Transcript_37028:182-1075(+)
MGNVYGTNGEKESGALPSDLVRYTLLRKQMRLSADEKVGILVRKNQVLHVHDGSAAMAAGLLPADVVVSWEGEALTEAWTVSQALAHSKSSVAVGGMRSRSGHAMRVDLVIRRAEARGGAETARAAAADVQTDEEASVVSAKDSDVSSAQLSRTSRTSTSTSTPPTCAEASRSYSGGQPVPPAVVAVDLLLHLPSGHGHGPDARSSPQPQGPGLGCKVRENRILDVFAGSAADAAGLRAGDLVVSWDGADLTPSFTIRSALFRSTARKSASDTAEGSPHLDQCVPLRVHRPCELQEI